MIPENGGSHFGHRPLNLLQVMGAIVQRGGLLEGSRWALASQALRVITNLLGVPVAFGYLGAERYGLWMVTLSSLSFVTLLDAGIAPSLKNQLTRALTANRPDDARNCVVAAGRLSLVVLGAGIVSMPVLGLLDWQSILNASAIPKAEVTRVVLWVFGVSVAAVCLSFIEAVYASQLRYVEVAKANSVAAVFSFASLIAAVEAQAPVYLLASVSGGCTVLMRLILAWRQRYWIRAHLRPATTNLIWSVLPDAVGFIGLQSANVMISSLPNILIARSSGVAEVAMFAIAMRLVSLPLMFVASVLPVFWPAFTTAWHRRSFVWIKTNLRRMVFGTVGVLAAYSIGLVAFGGEVLTLWLGDANLVRTGVFAILGIWLPLQGATYWLSTFLNSVNDLRYQVTWGLVQASVLYAAGAVLVESDGAFGVGLAMVLSAAFASTGPLAWRVRRKLVVAP